MIDIVERLRRIAQDVMPWNLCDQAADEIERLRKELAECERDRDEHLRSWNRVVEERIAVTKERDELVEFANEVRRSGNTRLASMAIATLAKLGADKTGEV